MVYDVTKMATAGELAFAVLRNDFHRPLIDGKANRDMIEDSITIGILSGALDPVDQETVDLCIDIVNDLLAEAAEKAARNQT